jgi:aryl-alcohol dehydrogenase-like predicted oxidoreductase
LPGERIRQLLLLSVKPSSTPIVSATTANQVHELVAATKLNLDKAALTVGQIGGRS